MIVITLAGDSKRFFENGYNIVKYKLPFKNWTVIEEILHYIPRDSKLLLVLNEKYNDVPFFEKILNSLNFIDFKVVEIARTKGQLETVYLGLKKSIDFFDLNESLTIFNGDTIRKIENWRKFGGDGYIETFIADGDHWSFVDQIGLVSKVTEKVRISDFCSSGLYYFKSVSILMNNYFSYLGELNHELFVAPFYNHLIGLGLQVISDLVVKENFIFCGTPSEYENSILKNN